MKKVFLAWQDPETRRWVPVGQLSWDNEQFRFVYTSREHIAHLEIGQRLYLMRDLQNPYDGMALMLRTADPVYNVGYCPRFYSAELSKLIELVGQEAVQVTASGVHSKAPLQFRLPCRLTAPWPAGFSACSHEAFAPLA